MFLGVLCVCFLDNTCPTDGDIFLTKFAPGGTSLVYSTYLGGSESDNGYGFAVDPTGRVYIAGNTYSSNFPTLKAYQKTLRGKVDAIVSVISADGASLVYSTYLGGTDFDEATDIVVDKTGAAAIVGASMSTNYPVKNALQKTNRGRNDIILSKLSPSGQSLVFSTYLGGTKSEFGFGLAADEAGSLYISGYTASADFPVKKAFQKSLRGEFDAVWAKVSSDGVSLLYSSYLGGAGHDSGDAIAVDKTGIVVVGNTSSTDFPVLKAFQKKNHGLADIFIAKFVLDGQSLVYSTYLGGSQSEYCSDLALDPSGAAYVVGGTSSTNFPVKNAYQTVNRGKEDGYLAKLMPGGGLVYSTYLGGADDDSGSGLSVPDTSGTVYITGGTRSKNFPVKNAFQKTHHGDRDAFVMKLVYK